MYIFTETTVLLDNEFYTVIFDGNLTKLQSEVDHTGVTCSQSEVRHTGDTCKKSTATSISISGPWEAVQRAYCTLLIQSKMATTSTDSVPNTNEEGEIFKTSISGVVGNINCNGAEVNKGKSATGTHACKICGLTFTTRHYLRKHTCLLSNRSICDSNSSSQIGSIQLELDPAVVATSKSEPVQDTTVAICNEEEEDYHHTATSEHTVSKRRTNVYPDQADGVLLPVEELEVIMKNVNPNEYGKFICNMCSYAASWKYIFRHHVLRNHIERIWKCEICGTQFGLKDDLTKHNIGCHSSNGKVQCPICLERYANIKSFRNHMRLDHSEREQCKGRVEQSKCSLDSETGTSTASEIDIVQHPEDNIHASELESGKVIIPSSSCSTDQLKCSTEQDKYSLDLETNTGVTSEISIVQDEENKINTSMSELESAELAMLPPSSSATHITENELKEIISNQTGGLQFSCPTCHYIAHKEVSFREHVMRWHMERKWECDSCNKWFGPKRDLLRHKRKMHGVQREISCTICKKIYLTKTTFENHMASHRRKWKCDICSKCYVRQKDLETHQLVHTVHTCTSVQTLNTCRICNHISCSKYALQKHMVLHRLKGELTHYRSWFKCTFCSKTFTNPYNLNVHIATHSKKLKAMCNQLTCRDCSKCFMSRKELLSHRKIHHAQTVKTLLSRSHSPKQDNMCSICGKVFSVRRNLMVHEMRHSDIKPFGCPHCKMTFKLHYACKRHMVLRHGYDKQDYEIIHQRMLINRQGLTLKDLNPDTETNLSNADNTDNVDNDSNAKTVLISKMGSSDTPQETECMEMTNIDQTDIIDSSDLTDQIFSIMNFTSE